MVNSVSSRTPRAFSGRRFADCQLLVCPGASGCSLPRAGLCTSLCWASFLTSPFIQPLKIPLNGGTTIWFINNSSQFCIQELKENSGGTAQLTEVFPSIPKPTSPAPSIPGSCLSADYHNTAFTDSDDLYPAGKGPLQEFQRTAVISPFCTWQLEHTKFSVSPHKSSSAKQPSKHQGHSPSTCWALCRQSSSPHIAHLCEHILSVLPASHSLPFHEGYTLTNSTNSPGNICYILKLFLDKSWSLNIFQAEAGEPKYFSKFDDEKDTTMQIQLNRSMNM